ncbi:hypothetical protein HZR23_00825 [Serpentinicella alkaliphila]|uniref:Uncharacterized protein n=1 Tax=Serpentinicella alkaliphila TaxID=1734049 RepID=A0A4R2U8L8_9FIRM|nr:hypothetical protein [Serpentinicella alkaliphila]QUH24481.1 hypothetical protein HZR23_00825 [Serpentinicella alkaliphila]TCQ04123.1 hypothetical protein EDD79_10071 [Serpentinicella alkaliphila]
MKNIIIYFEENNYTTNFWLHTSLFPNLVIKDLVKIKMMTIRNLSTEHFMYILKKRI